VRDGQGRLVAEETAYTAAGQLKEMAFGNGVRSQFGYDNLLRMTSIRTTTSTNSRCKVWITCTTRTAMSLPLRTKSTRLVRTSNTTISPAYPGAGTLRDEHYQYDAAGISFAKGT